MMIYVSLAVAIVGVLMYALAANPKLAEIGRISYGVGMLAFLLQLSPKMVGVLR